MGTASSATGIAVMNSSIIVLLAAVAAVFGSEDVIVAEPAKTIAAEEPVPSAEPAAITGHHTTQYHFSSLPIFTNNVAPVATIPDSVGSSIKTVAPVATINPGNVIQYSSPYGVYPYSSFVQYSASPLLNNLVTVKAAAADESVESAKETGKVTLVNTLGTPLSYSGVPLVYSYASSPSVLTYDASKSSDAVVTELGTKLDSSKVITSNLLPTIYSGFPSFTPFYSGLPLVVKAAEKPVEVEDASVEDTN